MAQNRKYNKNKHIESEMSDEAMTIARGIKQENQTKTQTKLVAQGIRKGIELYKSQQNKKQRELDKRKKKEIKTKTTNQSSDKHDDDKRSGNKLISVWLPWFLLGLSWLFYFWGR